VNTPGTTGGASTAQTFNVNAAIPTVTGINPTVVYAGSGDIQLTITGTNFLANSSVQLAGSSRPTVFVSPSELSASIPAADLATAGTSAITVFNPAPQGGTSNSLSLSIVAKPANQPPTANAGQGQSVSVGSTVTLNGYGSSDSNGNPLSFQWTLSSRPAGSSAVLSSTSSPTPSFVADQAGNYSIQLVVNDGANSGTAATVTISTLNSAPVANAGANQSAKIGTPYNWMALDLPISTATVSVTRGHSPASRPEVPRRSPVQPARNRTSSSISPEAMSRVSSSTTAAPIALRAPSPSPLRTPLRSPLPAQAFLCLPAQPFISMAAVRATSTATL
jgi:hypothetical protein